MTTWSAWEVVRHQVALCGVVLDSSGQRLPNVRVNIEDGPKAYAVKRAGATSAAAGKSTASLGRDEKERFEQRMTREDGTFFYLDLPFGNYRLKAIDARSGASDEKTAAVTRGKDGKIDMAKVHFTLKPLKPLKPLKQ